MRSQGYRLHDDLTLPEAEPDATGKLNCFQTTATAG